LSVDEKGKIEKIYRKSLEVLSNCSLRNGAILATDIQSENYPENVKNYAFVYPRDACYVCVAADLVGLHDIPNNFFKWCKFRAEGLAESGLFLAHKYSPNGIVSGDFDVPLTKFHMKSPKILKWIRSQQKVKFFYFNFQPDTTGSLLWAIHYHSKFRDVSEFNGLVKKAADGICSVWNKECFKIPSHDLWEETSAWPELKQVHTYSLASCIKGLECASEILGNNDRWEKTIKQMKVVLNKCYDSKLGYFIKTFGNKKNKVVDSSNMSLVWPFEQYPVNDDRMVKTFLKILKKNENHGGIYRYNGDKYDGKVVWGDQTLGGAGAWPILNFWVSIYLCLYGNKKDALKYFKWVVDRIEDTIPEQIKNGKSISINPLAWSHAMFVIAGKQLRLF